MVQFLLIFSSLANVILRLAVGAIYVFHGSMKFKNYKGTTDWFSSIGFKPGKFWGTLVALLEFVGGIAIILGFFTQIFALLLAIQMIVAFSVNLRAKQPFFRVLELDLILFATLVMLVTLGSGPYSLDNFFGFLF